MRLRKAFVVILFIGLFLMTLRPVADPDFWWHLRTGQWILETRTIPHADLFSYTNIGKPWIAHEWLSELFLYGLYRLGGYGLLILVFSGIITAAFLFSYLRSPKEARPYVAGFVLLLGAIAAAPTWGVRPQMISLLITSLFAYLLDRFRQEGKLKLLISLPLIMMLWVNLHAGYFLGLGIIVIYIVGALIEIIQAELDPSKRIEAPTFRYVLFLCGLLGACLLPTLVNPNGYHILVYPFQTLTSQSMQQFIQEWLSPDFHQIEWQPLLWLILALIGAGMLTKKTLSPTKILLTLAFGYAALHSMRHIPLFAIIVTPILAEQIGSLVRIRSEVQLKGKLLRWVVPVFLTFLVAVVGFRFVQILQKQSAAEAEVFPKAAVDWLENNQPQGNLFNSYGWGGYLIWRLYPQYPVYIDGRADVYGDNFIFDYMSIYRAAADAEEKLAEQDIDIVLVDPESPLANTLRRSTHWRVVFEDQTAILFTLTR